MACVTACGCARGDRAQPPGNGWYVHRLCVAADGSRIAAAAQRGRPGDAGFSTALLVATVPSGRVTYRKESPTAQDLPLQWLKSGPQLLVAHGLLDDFGFGQAASGIFALDVSTQHRDRVVPLLGLEDAARWSPDYREVIFQLAPATSWQPPEEVRTGSPDVYVASDARHARLLVSRAYLVAVAPLDGGPDYWVVVRKDHSLFAVLVPVGKERSVLSPSLGTTSGYSVSPNAEYGAGLGSETDGKTRLVVQRLGANAPPVVLRIPTDGRMDTVWSTDSHTIACFGVGGLWLCDPGRRTVCRVGREHQRITACAWLPGDQELLVASGPDISLVSRETGAYRHLCSAEGG